MASGHHAGPGHKGLAVTVETPLPVCGQPPGDTVPPLNIPKEVLCHPKLLFLCSPERVPPLGSNSLRLRGDPESCSPWLMVVGVPPAPRG